MKHYLTMWQVWAGIAVALGILLVSKTESFASLALFALILVCPVMMLFMMRGHNHK